MFLCAGLWRHPDQEEQTLQHWIALAKKLDEAKFHGMQHWFNMTGELC